MLEILTFDGVLTDANGAKLDVDCSVTLPVVSAAAAIVTIQIPHVAAQHQEFQNPCTLRGKMGSQEVEINELWYRNFPLGGTSRRLARGQLVINDIGILRRRHDRIKHTEPSVLFLLSAVEFFKETTASAMTSYSSTPSQSIELFRIQTADLGEIVFLKQWVVEHIKDGVISANIHAGFYAQVICKSEDIKNVDFLVESFREVLTVVSIFFRQAVDLLGWEVKSDTSTETVWLNPLKPYIAPYMPYEPHTFMVFPKEFKTCVNELVNKHLSCCKRIKKVIRNLSVSIAPHVRTDERDRFLNMFTALEFVVNLDKLTSDENHKLSETNAELITHLNRLKANIEAESSAFADKMIERVDGFVKTINSRSPSFSLKLESLFNSYPLLRSLTADLWPILGSAAKPGLKEIRDKIVHAKYDMVDTQMLAVSSWHFSIFIERLIFVLAGAQVPESICKNSFPLRREKWYSRDYWIALQKFQKIA